jgi:tetratricopeptide (TPR) repeat protein
VSINQYLEYYDTMWKALMEQQHEYPLQEYAERSVLTTWKLSYEQVKRQSEEASNLLQLWSFLYAGDLWYELVAHTKKLDESAMPDWLIVIAQNRLQFDRALALLIKYSLVEGKTETASYAMHSVLHSWCRYLGESEAERDSFRKLAMDIVGQTVPSSRTNQDWILQRRLLPHGQAILTGVKSDTEAETDPNIIWAYHYLARMFRVQYRYAEAERLLERALAGGEKAFGPEHPDTLVIVHNLGLLYTQQGELVEAEKLFNRALSGSEKVLGPKHTLTLDIVHSLGMLCRDQDKLVEAERLLERALAGGEKAFGPEHPDTLDIVHHLGILYQDQNRLVEAEAMYGRALFGSEKVLGREHTSTLAIVHNLGMLYRDQDKPVKAEAMYERAIAGYEKVFGPEHKSTIEATQDLSELRDLSTKSTGLAEVADAKVTVSEYTNARFSQDATLLSIPPTTPELMSRVEQEKHRPRKRDAFLRKLRLLWMSPGT